MSYTGNTGNVGNLYTPRPSNIFFIDTPYIVANSIIPETVDDRFMLQSLKYVQDGFVMPCLGSTLYEEMLQMIANEVIEQPENSKYLFLITEFIQPMMIATITWKILPMLSLQVKNKGVMKGKSEFSDQAEMADVLLVAQAHREMGSFWAQRLINYLVDNMNSFIEYLNPQALPNTGQGADLYYADDSTYDADDGVYIPDSFNNNFGKGWGLSLADKWTLLDPNNPGGI